MINTVFKTRDLKINRTGRLIASKYTFQYKNDMYTRSTLLVWFYVYMFLNVSRRSEEINEKYIYKYFIHLHLPRQAEMSRYLPSVQTTEGSWRAQADALDISKLRGHTE